MLKLSVDPQQQEAGNVVTGPTGGPCLQPFEGLDLLCVAVEITKKSCELVLSVSEALDLFGVDDDPKRFGPVRNVRHPLGVAPL